MIVDGNFFRGTGRGVIVKDRQLRCRVAPLGPRLRPIGRNPIRIGAKRVLHVKRGVRPKRLRKVLHPVPFRVLARIAVDVPASRTRAGKRHIGVLLNAARRQTGAVRLIIEASGRPDRLREHRCAVEALADDYTCLCATRLEILQSRIGRRARIARGFFRLSGRRIASVPGRRVGFVSRRELSVGRREDPGPDHTNECSTCAMENCDCKERKRGKNEKAKDVL